MLRLIAIIIVLLLLAGGAFYYFKSKNSPSQMLIEPSPELLIMAEPKNENSLIIKGGQIIANTNGKEEVLFTNVTNISEVRYGPDGKTVHFKQQNLDERTSNSCANIGDPFRHVDPGYPNPPPVAAPWDFQKIGNYGTISSCHGGFLKSENYFTYIEITPQKKAALYLENLSTNEKIKIDLPDTLAADLYPQPLNGAPTVVENKFMGVPIKGKNGNLYLYPQGDLMTKERLLIGVNRVLIAVNIKTRQFLKQIPFTEQSSIISDSYNILNKNGLPFAVIMGAWEGPESYENIVDISTDDVKNIQLYPDHQSHYSRIFFKIDPITWDDNSVKLNFVDAASITKTLPSEIILKQNALIEKQTTTSEEWDVFDKEVAAYLKANNPNYADYTCSLALGMLGGECYGLNKIDRYQYTVNSGLQKL